MPKRKPAMIGEYLASDYMAAENAYEALRTVTSPEEAVEVVTGLGMSAFRILDEKPGLFGNYGANDGWVMLRIARNTPSFMLFERLTETENR